MVGDPPIKESEIRDSLVARAEALSAKYQATYAYVRGAPDGEFDAYKNEKHPMMVDDLLVGPLMELTGRSQSSLSRELKATPQITYCAGLMSTVMMAECDQRGLRHEDGFHHVNANSMLGWIQNQTDVQIIGPSGVDFSQISPDADQNLFHESKQENLDLSLMNLPRPGDIAFDVNGLNNDQIGASHTFMITDFEIYEDGTVHIERLDAGTKAPHVSKRDFESVDDFLMHYSGVGFVNTVDVMQCMNENVEIVRDVPPPQIPNSPEIIGDLAKGHFNEITQALNNYDTGKAEREGVYNSPAHYELITDEEVKAAGEAIDQEIEVLMRDGVFSDQDRQKLDQSIREMAKEAIDGNFMGSIEVVDPSHDMRAPTPTNTTRYADNTRSPQPISQDALATANALLNDLNLDMQQLSGFMPAQGPAATTADLVASQGHARA